MNKEGLVYPTCFCLISYLPIFDIQKVILGEMYSSMTFNKEYSPEFYISLMLHHLVYNSELQNEVLVTSDNYLLSFFRYRNYKSVGLTLPNFTFQLLMETIELKEILDLVRFLLFEKKVILIRDDCNENAILIESLLMLLSPLYFSYYTI